MKVEPSPDPDRPTTSLRSLRSEPLFVRWATAEGVSMVGTSVNAVVLPLLVFQETGSAASTGLLFAIRVVPYLLFGLIAGPLADRGNRRLLIVGGNVTEGALALTIPVADVLGVLTIHQVYAVALASATAFVFSDAAVFGAVPSLVGPERLPAANGFLGTLTSAAEIVGPALGGALVATIGPARALVTVATTFFVTAAVQASIRHPFRTTPVTGERWPLRRQIGRAFGFVRRHRVVATLLVAGFGNSFSFGIVLGLLVPYAVERLGLSDDDGAIGLLYSGLGVGSLIAGLVFARLYRPERVPWLTPGSLALSATVIAGLLLITRWPVAALFLVAFSALIVTTITIGITYRQQAAPDELRASVNVLGRMVSWGGQPFGAAVGAVIAAVAGVRHAYVLAGVVMAVSSVGAAIALRRSAPPAGEHR